MSSSDEKGSVVKSAGIRDTDDLEFEYYLFEVLLNDRVEHEIQRMREYQLWEELIHQESIIPKKQ